MLTKWPLMKDLKRNFADTPRTQNPPQALDYTERDLDNEKTREKEDRRFRVVVLEKRTEDIVDGEKYQHIDHREHQTSGHWSQG